MAVASAGVSCSPTAPENELTPLRYLDPDPATGTTNSPVQPEASAQDPWTQSGKYPWSGKSSSSSGSASAGRTESPTDSKVCVEDLREQTERTAPVPVLPAAAAAFSTELAPVVPLSPEANAIEKPILAGQMTSLKTEVNELGAPVHRHDQRGGDQVAVPPQASAHLNPILKQPERDSSIH